MKRKELVVFTLFFISLGLVSAIGYVSPGDVYGNFRWDDVKNYSIDWSEYNGNLFYNNGNVGLGVYNPSSKLHVNGNAIFNGTINTDGNKIINLANGTAAQDAVTYSQLQSVSGDLSGNYVPYTGSDKAVSLSDYDFSVGTSDLFVDASAGRVGIGTTIPGTKLDVDGIIYSSSDVLAGGSVQATNYMRTPYITPFSSGGNVDVRNYAGDASYLSVNTTSGNVGIGTTSPSEKLHVTGNAVFNGTINTDGNKVINLANGTDAQDAVTKSQLDEVNSELSGNVSDSYVPYTGASQDVDLGSNDLFVDGNVGIGTTGPDGRLHLHGTVNDKTRILVTNLPSGGSKDNLFKVYDSSGDGIVEVADRYSNQGTPDIKLHSNGDSYLNGGNVGIGTTSPDKTLHINSGSLHSSTLLLERTGTHANSWQIGFWGTNLNIHPTTGNLTSTDTFQLDTNMVGINKIPTEALDVSGNALITGNVGIGTTSPDNKLHIMKSDASATAHSYSSLVLEENDNTAMSFLTPNDKSAYIMFGDPEEDNIGQIKYDHSIDTLDFKTGGAEGRMVIDNNGNVGIGTRNPTEKLDVAGDVNAYNLRINGSAVATTGSANVTGSGTSNYLSKWTSGSNLGNSVIYDNGTNIGVGTDSPSSKMEVEGTFKATASSSSMELNSDGDVRIGI